MLAFASPSFGAHNLFPDALLLRGKVLAINGSTVHVDIISGICKGRHRYSVNHKQIKELKVGQRIKLISLGKCNDNNVILMNSKRGK